jgi:uncharacterized protein with PQ loop repeat
MTSHSLGEITLSFSTFIYIIWLLPQLKLNFKRKSTKGLSFWMHSLLFLGYSADLAYGFGLSMEWQYRMVTIVGLLSLSIQHWQFGYYELGKSLDKFQYYVASIALFSFLVFSIHTLGFTRNLREFYNFFGMVSNVAFLIYLVPQIVTNYLNQSTEGLSLWFVIFTGFLDVCDLISACTLQWSWPSLLGPSVGFLFQAVLLFQIYYYGKRYEAAENS